MKIPKDAKDDAKRFVDQNNDVTVEDIAQIFKAKAEPPDVAELIEREFKRAARRFLADQKDKRGTRKLFSTGRNGRFSNVEHTSDAIDLLVIKDGLVKNIEGNQRDLRKIENRLKVVSGQMSMVDWLESIGETDAATAW